MLFIGIKIEMATTVLTIFQLELISLIASQWKIFFVFESLNLFIFV